MALALVPAAASAASGGPSVPQASTATVKTCPAGQSLQGSYCEPLKCPAGQTAEGNTCVPLKCPAGDAAEGNYCEPLKCPAGQHPEGNYCEKNGGGGGGPPPPPPPCTVNAPQSAAVAAQAALTAVTGAGISGLAKTGRVSFSFVSQTCGGYRFLLRVRNPRGKHHSVTIGYTTVINYLSTILQGKTKTVNVQINKVGRSILSYAKAHKLSLRMLVITHVRPSNSKTSVQVLDGILLK